MATITDIKIITFAKIPEFFFLLFIYTILPVIDALKTINKTTTKTTAKPISLKMLKPFLNINFSPEIIIIYVTAGCQEFLIRSNVILTISSVFPSILTFSLISSPKTTKTFSPATNIGSLSLKSWSTLLFVK